MLTLFLLNQVNDPNRESQHHSAHLPHAGYSLSAPDTISRMPAMLVRENQFFFNSAKAAGLSAQNGVSVTATQTKMTLGM